MLSAPVMTVWQHTVCAATIEQCIQSVNGDQMKRDEATFKQPHIDGAVDRIIDFLASCDDVDVVAGVGAIFGLGSEAEQSAFRAGIARAITNEPK